MSVPRRLRVLQVITHLDLGGAESIAISLAGELRETVDASMFAVLRSQDGPVARDMAARLDAMGAGRYVGTTLPLKRGGLLQAGIRLAALVRRTLPDLVHVHTELPEACWAVASLLSRQVRSTPMLRTVHNARLWPQWRRIGQQVERRLGDLPAVAVSRAAMDGLIELRAASGLPSLPASGAWIVPNGVAPAVGGPVAGSRGPVRRILFAGRLEAQKGADLLPGIWAMARARTGRATELTIMGSGSMTAALQAAFADDPSVRLVPPSPGLSKVVGDYDLLLMPSRFEGFGLVAVEAAMAGVAVIAFAAPGLRDLFPGGYAGLAQPGDIVGIAQLLADAIETPDGFLDEAARSHIARQFGLARMAAQYAEIYAKLATANGLST